MTKCAKLITPEGTTIELPPDLYSQVKELIEAHQRNQNPRLKSEMKDAVQVGYGMLAGDDSLIEALREERLKDRAREDAKFDQFLK